MTICDKCGTPMRVRTSKRIGDVQIRYAECLTCEHTVKMRVPAEAVFRRAVRIAQ